MADPKPSDDFALFVSSVDSKLVSRYGTPHYIGAERVGGKLEFDNNRVVALRRGELDRYRREYRGHLRRKELVERTRADFDAMHAASGAAPEPTNAAAPKGKASKTGA